MIVNKEIQKVRAIQVDVDNIPDGNNLSPDLSYRNNDLLAITFEDANGNPIKLGQAIISNLLKSTPQVLADADIINVNAESGNNFIINFDSSRTSRTIAPPTNGVNMQVLNFRIKTSASNQLLTLNTGIGGFRFSESAPENLFIVSTESGKVDYFSARYNSEDDKWDVQALMKGY